jgi:Transcriptional regulator
MELRHLRYFVAVAESLHFGQAAAKLRIAQPSLSHQIRQLEDEVQTSLLRRTNRRVELTDAGRLFLQEARDIIARADHATVMARRIGSANAGRLRVGIGYCTDQTDIAALLGAFHDQHPDIHVETKTLSVPLQLAALLDGQLDVAFVRPPVSDSALNSEVVISEALVVALPPKHRLASRRRLQLSALANEPFILPRATPCPSFMMRSSRHAVGQASSPMLLTGPIICTWSSVWWRPAPALRSFPRPPASSIRAAWSTERFARRPTICKRSLRGGEGTRQRRWPNSSARRDEC